MLLSRYVREISELGGVSYGGTSEALADLAAAGLARRQERGKLVLYSVDTADPVVRQFKILLSLASLAPLLDQLKPIARQIILFGSRAEGTDALGSDFDLFVIADNKEAVYEAVSQSTLAGQIRPVVFTPLESADQNPACSSRQGISPGRRMPLAGNPEDPRFDHVLVIESQSDHRRTAGGRQADNVGATVCPRQVLTPDLSARIKEWDKLAGNGVYVVCLDALGKTATVTPGATHPATAWVGHASAKPPRHRLCAASGGQQTDAKRPTPLVLLV